MAIHLLHLGLPVRDQQRAVRFYATWFGFDPGGARRYPDGTMIVRNPDGFDLALHPGTAPEQPLPALRVPDARRRRRPRAARQDGSRPGTGPRALGGAGYVGFNCLDPDGWRVEVYWKSIG